MSEPPKENPAIREEPQGDEGRHLPSHCPLSGRTSSAGRCDAASYLKPEYLTNVLKWDIGVTPKCPLRGSRWFSLKGSRCDPPPHTKCPYSVPPVCP